MNITCQDTGSSRNTCFKRLFWVAQKPMNGNLWNPILWYAQICKCPNQTEKFKTVSVFLKKEVNLFDKMWHSWHTKLMRVLNKTFYCLCLASQDALEVMCVTEWMLADFIDVTLVSEDTYWRLDWWWWRWRWFIYNRSWVSVCHKSHYFCIRRIWLFLLFLDTFPFEKCLETGKMTKSLEKL